MGTFNDDLSLILTKAKLNGFLPDVKDEEVGILRDMASSAFSVDDTIFGSAGPAYGQRWVFDGDSITIGGNVTTAGGQSKNSSWAACMVYKSQGRINYVRNAGLGGQRIDGGLTRFAAEVAAYTPDVVLATFGTNDIGQGRTLAQFMNDLEIYYRRVSAINARLIIGTIWPRNDTPAARDKTTLWNQSIRRWARLRGVQVIDWHSRFGTADGSWPAGESTDGIHPNNPLKSYLIGSFAWDCVKNRVPTSQVIARPEGNGTDLLTNGFFTILTTMAAPVLSAGTATVGSGTLPAGTYSYRYTSRTYYGESLPSAERVVTLSAPGKISITNGTVALARGYRVYRKGPGETTWRFINYISVATDTFFVDDGSYTPGEVMSGIDSSQLATGLTAGTSSLRQMPKGQPLFTQEDGILGNIFWSFPAENPGSLPNEFYTINVVAGEVYEAAGLIQSAGEANASLCLRFRDAGQTLIDTVSLSNDKFLEWGFAQGRATVPATATTMRVSMESSSNITNGYAKFAEIQLKKIS